MKPKITLFAQIDMKNAILKFKDGTTPTPNEVEIKIGEGNFTWTERKEREYTLNRGILDEVRNGDQTPVEVRLDATWEYIKGKAASSSGDSATVTPEDAVKNRGGAADWASSDTDACKPYAVDIEITYTPDCASGDEETITFADFRYEQIDHDMRAGTLSFTGKCNIVEPAVVRAAQ